MQPVRLCEPCSHRPRLRYGETGGPRPAKIGAPSVGVDVEHIDRWIVALAVEPMTTDDNTADYVRWRLRSADCDSDVPARSMPAAAPVELSRRALSPPSHHQ